MPRKSAASLLTPHIGERPRLQPPTTGLSTRERQLFRDVVAGLSPEHLKAEDLPLLMPYVRRLCQCEHAAREISSGSIDRFWLELQSAGLKTVNAIAIRLRISVKARALSNQRKPGSARSSLSPPWGDREPHLYAVGDDDLRSPTGERDFARLRERVNGAHGKSAVSADFSSPEPPTENSVDKNAFTPISKKAQTSRRSSAVD